jgi:hypothetical protein
VEIGAAGYADQKFSKERSLLRRRGHSRHGTRTRLRARSALRIPINDPACPEIAKRIIELATTGERDTDKLCDYALDGPRLPPAA